MEANEPVPALADETADLKSAPIVAETPDQKDVPVAEAIETTPPAADNTTPAPAAEASTALPNTASAVPLIALLGLASLGVAFTLKRRASQGS